MMIDNGNHLLLSGNHTALAYLQTIGASDRLVGPAAAEFPFIDLAANERWTLQPLKEIHFDPAYELSNPSYTVSRKYITMLLLLAVCLGGLTVVTGCDDKKTTATTSTHTSGGAATTTVVK